MPSQKSDLIRMSLAVFLLIPFFQCRMAAWSWRFPYSEIFFQFCRNLFLLFQAAIVIAVFWGLLVTAGLLFEIVGLESVPYLIFNPVIAVPLSSLAIAVSITVAIKHPGIDSLGRWILSVLAWLLPFFSILSMLFILCLPYSGMKTLWNTGQASTLMLLLQFGTIILANAAWLDGSKPAFKSRFVNSLSQISLLCLPIYTIICMYSVGLRVQQYGLSTDRIQAVFLVVVTGIWGLGYAGAILIRKWASAIGKVNIACILIMAVIVALMNSPVLDPYRLAAFNQMKRLETGKIEPEDFDYTYTRFNLGRYGNEVLQELRENSSSEAVQNGIKAAFEADPSEYLNYVRNNVLPVSKRREILSSAKIYPEGATLTDAQINYFVNTWSGENFLKDIKNSGEIAFVFLKAENYMILFTQSAAVVYKIKIEGEEPEPLGMLRGVKGASNVFNLAKVADAEAVMSGIYDIKLGNAVFQILR